ncbi:hypothetical protein [Aureimonas populi]|uniref:hypothetical protein n=1 Tax=Aureimonas populi TaxID=1701758 RepID=UPI001AE746CD|nr:hypothetical protein [Aureimonas populi]
MREALAGAYSGNPSLNASRAELRATQESVPQARAGARPSASVQARASAIGRGEPPRAGGVDGAVERPGPRSAAGR